MRALVTGATGMLGGHVVERLVEAGWRVRALVRVPPHGRGIPAPGVELVGGDLTDPMSLRRAASGCDAVVNAAAAIGPGRDHEAFRAVNVVGAAHLIAAASGAGARLVHVSSTAVFGRDRYRSHPTDESEHLPELPERDAYGRSKQEAERLVLAAHARGAVRAVVVRPPVMYGRHDRQFAPRLGPVLAQGFFPLIGGGRTTLALVHADAVAQGIVRAATREEAAGKVYHLTDDFELTVADLVRLAGQGLGRRVLAPRVPPAAGRAFFLALRLALRAGGRADLAPHAEGLLDMLTRDNPFTSERARRELSWAPSIRPAEGVPEAFRWWRASRVAAATGGGRGGGA
jgi:nucleoside-diphosphate-sugar epimerase